MARTFGHGPLHRWLGIELGRQDAEGATCRLSPREEFLQEEGVVQGGILTALADATAVYPLLEGLGEDRSVTSVEFKLNFLRPATLAQGTLEATSRVLRRGRSLAVCTSTVRQADREVAHGIFTYTFFERR